MKAKKDTENPGRAIGSVAASAQSLFNIFADAL